MTYARGFLWCRGKKLYISKDTYALGGKLTVMLTDDLNKAMSFTSSNELLGFYDAMNKSKQSFRTADMKVETYEVEGDFYEAHPETPKKDYSAMSRYFSDKHSYEKIIAEDARKLKTLSKIDQSELDDAHRKELTETVGRITDERAMMIARLQALADTKPEDYKAGEHKAYFGK